MGIFASIKNAVFGKDEVDAKPAVAAPSPAQRPAAQSAAPADTAISEAEMAQRIAAMSEADKYNWQTSIVDLMKLVGIDPSYANRKELAGELGMTDYEGTAEQNIALHHAVMNLLALEGGKVGGMLKD